MAYNDPSLLYEDEILTNISFALTPPEDFVAERLFGVVPVTKQSGKYWKFNNDNSPRAYDDIRVPGSEANELPPMMVPAKDVYFAEEHALEDIIPWEEMDAAEFPFRPLQESTERLVGTIQLNREIVMNTMVTTVGNYATGHSTTLAGTAQWSDYTNSDPFTNVKTARKAIQDKLFREPNTAIMGWDVAWQMEDHPKFLSRLNQAGIIQTTEQTFSKLLRVPQVIVARGYYNTAGYNAVANMQPLWGKDVLFAFVAPTPGQRQVSFGYEFTWAWPSHSAPEGAGTGGLQPVERWTETKRKADVIRVSRRYDLKLVGVDATDKIISGYLIKNAVA